MGGVQQWTSPLPCHEPIVPYSATEGGQTTGEAFKLSLCYGNASVFMKILNLSVSLTLCWCKYSFAVMRKCWREGFEERPTFKELVSTVGCLLSSIAGYTELTMELYTTLNFNMDEPRTLTN